MVCLINCTLYGIIPVSVAVSRISIVSGTSHYAIIHIDTFISHYTCTCYIAAVCDLSQYINSKLPGRSEHAPLFIYIESEIIAPREATMAQLYQEYREDDYFLYLAYYEKNHYQDKTN